MRIKVVAGGLSALALSVTQAATGQPALQLGDSVITGTGFEVAALMSPGSITRIGEDELRRNSLADVAELFRDVPGVILTDDGTPGMKRISIRGESSRRVTIRIDGQTMTDHTGYGTPLLIDPAIIERVEVVRGPSSVINGSNAIGGVVNIITKRGSDVPLEAYVGGGYYSATQGYRSNAGLTGGSGDFDYRLSLSRSEHADRRTRGYGVLDNSSYDSESAAMHVGYRRDNHYVAFKAERFDLSAGSWSDPRLNPGAEFALDFPKRDQQNYALFYEATDLSPLVRKLSANAYSRTVDRELTTDILVRKYVPNVPMPMTVVSVSNSLDEQRTKGATLQTELELFTDQTTLLGLEYMDDELDSNKLSSSTVTFMGPPAVSLKSSNQKARQQTFSAFAQQDWQFFDDWTAYLGGRFYRVESELERTTEGSPTDDSDNRMLGSLGLVYSPEPHWALRANLAQGYSYPTLAQQHMVASVSSSKVQYGNPDLKPERARVLELGWRYEVPSVTVDTVLFHTVAKDYIALQSVAVAPAYFTDQGGTPMQYTNISEAKTTGVELSLEMRPEWFAQPHAAISLSRREFKHNGYSSWKTGLPTATGILGMRSYLPLSGLDTEFDLFVRAASGAERKSYDEDTTAWVVKPGDKESGYATLNFAMNFDYQERLSAKVLLGNLLNRSYQPIDELPGLKRHIDTEITLTF